MKILYNFSNFSPITGGGTTNLTSKLMMELKERGHDVTLYTSDYKQDNDYINKLGVRALPFKDIINLSGLHFTPGLFNIAKKDISNYDVIHLHAQRSLQHAPICYYAHKHGVPYIIDSHGSTPKTGKKLMKVIYDTIFSNMIYKNCSHFIAENEFGKQEYITLGIPEDKITIIHPQPFPIEDFLNTTPPDLFKNTFNIDKNKKIIMSFGRIHPIKGIIHSVEGFARVLKRRNDVVLVIVGGDDGGMNQINKKIKELGIGNDVILTGFVTGELRLSAMAAGDVAIQTSIYEQGAWSLFEIVLCGTPIIASSHTGAGIDVKRIDAGYLVDIYNYDEIANTINYVLDHPYESKQKAQNGRDYLISEASIHKVIEKFESVYEKCLKKG